MTHKTREPQYQFLLDLERTEGLERLGLMTSQVWRDDPRRLGFLLARYKFVSKMFSGMKRVLEIGCADGFGARVVRQEVEDVVAVDFDPVFIEHNQRTAQAKWPIDFRVHDMLDGPVREDFDGVYALDVFEHISPNDEQTFVDNVAASLSATGVCIIGTPSLQSQAFASAPSKEGHVNCKDATGLKVAMSRRFGNVFIFSMNDELVHTGFYPMAHYLMALCCQPKP